MSSFRRLKAEATLRLYSLPRRELQVLCKQYGVPANKTNVSMADALSACILAENGKSKASSGTSSLGVSKSTPMKFKVEKKNRIARGIIGVVRFEWQVKDLACEDR